MRYCMDRPAGFGPLPSPEAIPVTDDEATLDEGIALPAPEVMGTACATVAMLARGARLVMPDEITGADCCDRSRDCDSFEDRVIGG